MKRGSFVLGSWFLVFDALLLRAEAGRMGSRKAEGGVSEGGGAERGALRAEAGRNYEG